MPGPPPEAVASLDRTTRRRAIGLTYANAFVWALGNGLVATTLVSYLARELGARGIAIAWVIASPRFAGVLRIAAPQGIALAERLAIRIAGPAGAGWGRKAVCLAGYAASAAMLVVVPLAVIAAKQSRSPDETQAAWLGALGLLVVGWCAYHLLEYVATVALWSWIGDLYPAGARARLLGGRERWLVVGRVVGIVASVGLALVWESVMRGVDRWAPLVASASVGAVLIATAIVPLAWLPSLAMSASSRPVAPWRTAVAALRRKPFRRLLAYSCWLGVANGVVQSAQFLYASRVLGISYASLRPLQAGMYAGQAAIAPRCGALIQRFGAKRVMLPAQLVVATGSLFFWFATPESQTASLWLLAAAYVVWIAWAPINVGLDTLKLGLADPRNNAPYVAVYHALSDLVNAAMIVAGGVIYDVLTAGDDFSLRVYAGIFLAGWALRSLGALFVWRLVAPPPATLRNATIEG